MLNKSPSTAMYHGFCVCHMFGNNYYSDVYDRPKFNIGKRVFLFSHVIQEHEDTDAAIWVMRIFLLQTVIHM